MNARPLCLVLFAALLLAACSGDGGSGDGRARGEAQDPLAFRYACADDYAFHVEIDGPTVRVFMADTTAALTRVEAASGAKYQGDSVTFWSKGDGALLQTPSGTHRGCTQRAAP